MTLFVESLNRGIERAFGGDNCHNIDRILRLPGTANTKPDAGGRRACVIAHYPERAYRAERFSVGRRRQA